MPITFNADEIFEMAEQIERNAAGFYRQAAGKAADKNIRQMFTDTAAMEDSHLITFQVMRKQLSEAEKATSVYDPDNEAIMYLQTMADAHGYEGKVSVAQKLTGRESIEEILKTAVDAEKNSVVFYTGLKDLVSSEAGRDKVEAIIKEELGHLATLTKELGARRKS